MFWVHLIGRNGNTDQPVDVWDCSFRWLPNLMTEIRGASSQVGAAVESFRNEMARQNQDLLAVTIHQANRTNETAALPHHAHDEE